MPRFAMRRRYDGCSAENRLIFESSSTAFSGGIVDRADGVAGASDGASPEAATALPPPMLDASVSSNSALSSSLLVSFGAAGSSLIRRDYAVIDRGRPTPVTARNANSAAPWLIAAPSRRLESVSEPP